MDQREIDEIGRFVATVRSGTLFQYLGLEATSSEAEVDLAIKKKRADLHRYFMVAAFAASACFLVGYLAYHAVHGDTKFGGVGAVRTVYLVLLASHVLLSLFIVPLSLTAFWFAWKREFKRHTKVTRWLHPIWLYVSVTGVVVYLMLSPYYPA